MLLLLLLLCKSHASSNDVGCSVVGCARPELLVGMTLLRRDNDEATIHCNLTGRQWSVKCRKSVWMPISSEDEHHQQNCSMSSVVVAAGTIRGSGAGGRQLTSSAAAGLAHHPAPARVTTFPFSTSHKHWMTYNSDKISQLIVTRADRVGRRG